MKPSRLALVALLATATLPVPAGAKVEIKIATVAPRGSMWMRIFNKMKKKILKATGGEVKLRFYPGQVQGDERDVVRKMRTGQLDGGGFTSVGLSMLNPNVLVLQMPGMFRTYAQLDRVRKAMQGDFDKTFLDRGYVALGWAEVGPIHIFSKYKITSVKDMRKRKVWVWSDDPISARFLKELGIQPRKLGLPGVLPALNTGIVDTVFNSPLGCMALQWHTKLNYMSAEPGSISVGATVITKKAFERIKPEHRELFLKIARKYHEAMIKRGRRDNAAAFKALQKHGLKVVPLSKADRALNERAAMRVVKAFVPRYFPKALLDKVMKYRGK